MKLFSIEDIILEMGDEVPANAGVDVFEEVSKLIFTKLYDEFLSRKDKEVINYFTNQVIKTLIAETTTAYGDKPSYVDGSDYDSLKAAVSGISDEGFKVLECRFAVSEKGGKDNSGDYIYLKNGNGQYKLDKNGHLVVEHDLHNHNGELPDGIAEAFIEFAKSEVLSFWK